MTDHHNHDHDPDIFDRGLAADMETFYSRRGALKLLGAAGLVAGGAVAAITAGGAQAATAAVEACVGKVPTEIGGPYPADGSNGPDILTQSGVVRSDIRSSFGSFTGVATGVPLRYEITLLDATSCAPLAGAALYIWQCDKDGAYTLYSAGKLNQNYLRGVQVADSTGTLAFQAVFPGCYPGRWPHAHFEVYNTLAQATASSTPRLTSQLALPAANCATVYATSAYSTSLANYRRISLSNDMVFRDGYSRQMPTVTGDLTTGYTAKITVSV
ncbi:intradiol ring-cleavage dioxygenase [Amycolatopsis sp. NPDC051128]|uniref:dioxygenase family protein n=1 Tax=Amycolatopsis sp. NPDC051128 TaxID=3155412 RepID=UPI003437BD18